LQNVGWDGSPKRVLDAGAGSGQVVRLLKGIPFLEIEACDIDAEAQKFFKDNPETADVPYYEWNIVDDKFNKYYDAIIIRGVYHHIPRVERVRMLSNLCSQASILINADEGILEYETPQERIEHCEKWYGYVIRESKRRKLTELAEMETENLKHEKLDTADDGGDFKESPTVLIRDVEEAKLRVSSLDRLGRWNELKGGFYTAVITK
jgi:SAM-dependent methyltransferase